MDVNQAIDGAIALHQAGDLAAAEAAYRNILVATPGLADIHYLLGMACLGQGRAEAAVKSLRTALRMKDTAGEWWHNLGVALRQAGDASAAADAFAAAVTRLDGLPAQQAAALAEQGAMRAAAGDGVAAESMLRRALALSPTLTAARNNLAALLFNRFTEDASLYRHDAVPLLTEAAALAPHNRVFAIRLGVALLRAERATDALAAFDRALSLETADLEALLGRSDALSVLGRFEEAMQAAAKAVDQAPGQAGPLVALGAAYHGLGMLDSAETALKTALALDPGSVPALVNRGTLLRDLGDDPGAEKCYQQALKLAPDVPVVHWQRAQARLLAGDLDAGWQEYEWRWAMPGFGLPAALRALPVWQGEELPPGEALLVHAEQGHGDSLQFGRYLTILHDRGIKIHVQTQPALVRLFKESLPPDIEVAALGASPPVSARLRCPLLSLPLRMGTMRLADIPAELPYLHVPDARRRQWRDRLRDLPGLKVGLVWAGDSRAGEPRAAAIDRRRSLSLAQLTLLGTVPGVSFVSLQKGSQARMVKDVSFTIHDWTDELSDFADTAALVAELDLVIGVDTAVIHLAGALARPTWVMSRFDGCWRWLRLRHDNPWYPGLRLFRQKAWGDWRFVVIDLVNSLVEWSAAKEKEVH